MKHSIIRVLAILWTLCSSTMSHAQTINPPSNCIQYTDECGNMCIKKRDNSRSCSKTKTCIVPQQYMCVAIVNDVDLDENKNKIIKPPFQPFAFWSYSSSQNSGNITTGLLNMIRNPLNANYSNTYDPNSCSNETKPVCAMLPIVCNFTFCYPVIQTFESECAAKNAWAKYIQRGKCTVERNIKQ